MIKPIVTAVSLSIAAYGLAKIYLDQKAQDSKFSTEDFHRAFSNWQKAAEHDPQLAKDLPSSTMTTAQWIAHWMNVETWLAPKNAIVKYGE